MKNQILKNNIEIAEKLTDKYNELNDVGQAEFDGIVIGLNYSYYNLIGNLDECTNCGCTGYVYNFILSKFKMCRKCSGSGFLLK